MIIDRERGLHAIYGGLLLGGGGGGHLESGVEVLDLCLKSGPFEVFPIDTLSDDQVIITAALVGSPAAKDKYVAEHHYEQAYQLFCAGSPIAPSGIITNEMGAQAITNGWVVSSKYNLPFIDAPCNGRAHPTGKMGSMGLSSISGYISYQSASGGKDSRDTSLFISGTLDCVASVISTASIAAGGFVTVLRNPVTARYLRENAAIGAFEMAVKLGEIIFMHRSAPLDMLEKLNTACGLEVIDSGIISRLTLDAVSGLDLGLAQITGHEARYDISIWNEYITLDDSKGNRLATFPDLIAIIDARSGLPIISAELEIGAEVYIAKVPKARLILGSGMFDKAALLEAQTAVKKDLYI